MKRPGVFCAAIAIVLGLLEAFVWMPNRYRIDGCTTTATAHTNLIQRSLHPVYPHSLIPGGAYTPGELRSACGRDPVLQRHYIGFDTRHSWLVLLNEDRWQYASARTGGSVYWTKHRVLVRKGELLLTDGHGYIRCRCGNRLSAARPDGGAWPWIPGQEIQDGGTDEMEIDMPPSGIPYEHGLVVIPNEYGNYNSQPSMFDGSDQGIAVPGAGTTPASSLEQIPPAVFVPPFPVFQNTLAPVYPATPVLPVPPAIVQTPEPSELPILFLILIGAILALTYPKRNKP
jgi:hypothetical protein